MPKIIRNDNHSKSQKMDIPAFSENFSFELKNDDIDLTVAYLLKSGISNFMTLHAMGSSELQQIITANYRAALAEVPGENNDTINPDEGLLTPDQIDQILRNKLYGKKYMQPQKRQTKVDLDKNSKELDYQKYLNQMLNNKAVGNSLNSNSPSVNKTVKPIDSTDLNSLLVDNDFWKKITG